MTGENGVPETPDWLPESRPCTIFDIVPRVKATQVAVPPNVILGDN